MSLLLLAAMLTPAAVVSPQPQLAEPEIVVIGRKLRLTEGVITTNVITRQSKCKVEKSSGDVRIDNAVCDIAMTCLRRPMKDEAFRNCVKEGRQRFLAQLSSGSEGGL